jgi:amino acid transporter
VALLTVGVLAMIGSTLSLGIVIDALVTMRILVQFIGQMAALVLLRRQQPDLPRPFRVWLYPVPLVVALFGWLFLFATTDPFVILFGLALLAAGGVAFLVWSKQTRRWPFAVA